MPLPGGGFENRCRLDPSPLTPAELDAFADQVAAIAADATLPDRVRWNALSVLRSATVSEAHSYGGTPYPRARVFDLLVEVYEKSGYGDALDDIWEMDPERGPAYVRGVFERSERPPLCPHTVPSDPLPRCEGYSVWEAHDTPWCEAGGHLFGGIVAAAWDRLPGRDSTRVYDNLNAVWTSGDGRDVVRSGAPDPMPAGLPEHVEDWHRRCR